MVQCITTEQVNDAFILNAPLISSTIRNLTIQTPAWFRDLLNPMPWPEGEGNSMQELVFRGELPAIEEGFDSWTKLDDPTGCGPVCVPNCSYNMHTLGGSGMESKVTTLMMKDFRSPDYCVSTISSFRQYDQTFQAIVKNLWNQIDFHKEYNVGQNFLTSIAKKYVYDNGGFKPNLEDPWSYRPIGTTVLSALNIGMLTQLYGTLRRMPDAVPYAVQGGMPLYAMVASDELIANFFRDDPNLHADYRAAAAGSPQYADALINKYNLTDTIRGMFFPVGHLYPRRFRYDTGTNRWIRISPWLNNVPTSVGTYTGPNPRYQDPDYATHEEVLFHGRDPMSTWYKPTPTTIGEGTEFGPEPGFWDYFEWINPQTDSDPFKRQGYFATTAKIALSADNSESVIGLLVPRAPNSTGVAFYPTAPCPPEASECTNEVPDVDCPTPIVLSWTAHPITANTYFIEFAAPVDADPEDSIQLEVSNGGYITVTVATAGASADQKKFMVTYSGTLPACDRFVRIYTGESLGCSAKVLSYTVNPLDNTQLDLQLDRPIKADTNADVVTLKYGNGTTISATVTGTPNQLTNVWRVDIGGSAYSDTVGGIVEVCVPTTTDSSCPACGTGVTATQCS